MRASSFVAVFTAVAAVVMTPVATSAPGQPAFDPFPKFGCFTQQSANCCGFLREQLRDYCPPGQGYVVPYCDAQVVFSPFFNGIYFAGSGAEGFDQNDIGAHVLSVLCQVNVATCSQTAPGGCNISPTVTFHECKEYDVLPDLVPCYG